LSRTTICLLLPHYQITLSSARWCASLCLKKWLP
jgi:hypothetical protein